MFILTNKWVLHTYFTGQNTIFSPIALVLQVLASFWFKKRVKREKKFADARTTSVVFSFSVSPSFYPLFAQKWSENLENNCKNWKNSEKLNFNQQGWCAAPIAGWNIQHPQNNLKIMFWQKIKKYGERHHLKHQS